MYIFRDRYTYHVAGFTVNNIMNSILRHVYYVRLSCYKSTWIDLYVRKVDDKSWEDLSYQSTHPVREADASARRGQEMMGEAEQSLSSSRCLAAVGMAVW